MSLFTRIFAVSDCDILDFLLSDEQHPLRRAQVRQILTLMRDTNRPRYLIALRTVLAHPNIQVHIKHTVVQWLSKLDNATRDELSIVLQTDGGGEEFPVPMRKVLFVSKA